MIKRKTLVITLIATITVGILGGCASNEKKTGESGKIESNVQKDGTENDKAEGDIEKKFNIYDDILNCEYRGSNLRDGLRNPDKFKEKSFSFLGQVISTNTNDKGIQEVILEVVDSETIIQTESTPMRSKVKLNYEPKRFDGERLVKDDYLAVKGISKGLVSNEEHGDLLVFDVEAIVDEMSYLGVIALDKHFESMGLNSKDMELELLEGKRYREVMSDETMGTYIGHGEKIALFSSKNGVYWSCTMRYDDPQNYIYISSGKKDDREEVFFEEKAEVQLFYGVEF